MSGTNTVRDNYKSLWISSVGCYVPTARRGNSLCLLVDRRSVYVLDKFTMSFLLWVVVLSRSLFVGHVRSRARILFKVLVFILQRRQIVKDFQAQEEHTGRYAPVRSDEARRGYAWFGKFKIGRFTARGWRSQRMGRRQQ